MTKETIPTDLDRLPLDDLIDELRRHGATAAASLQTLLDRGALTEAEARRVARRLADAVGSPVLPLLRKAA